MQLSRQSTTRLKPLEVNLPNIDLSIVTWNSAYWIAEFFNSLLGQNYPLYLINVLIRDNGSNDDTVERCQEVAANHRHKFIGFQVTRGDNIGFGRGHNGNLELGVAPFFLVTNIDLVFAPDSIRQAITAAISDDGRTASWEFRQKPYEHPKLYNPVTFETSWSSSACIMFRRAALEAIGGYEERIFMYGEDVELSYRLRDRGYRLKYCPQAVCWHYSYEHAEQIKPLQFFGSTLANFYIRLRYGSLVDILVGVGLYLALWIFHPKLPHLWRGLLKNGASMIRNAPYFLLTRKSSHQHFPFYRWDYEIRREGAFYTYPSSTPENLPLVSVIMRTCRGRLPWLREAVASVCNQTYPRIELVVVEDGSDEARFFMEEEAHNLVLESVIYCPLPKQGRCSAGNAGLTLAQGEYFNFLDDDDLFFAEHLEVLVTELNAHAECDLAYAVGIAVGTQVITTDPLHYKATFHSVLQRQPFSRPVLWHHNYIPIQTAMFRRSLYQRHGGLDTGLDNLEDWNLWTRYSTDSTFLFVDKATSLYRVPADKHLDKVRQKKLDEYYKIAVEKQRDIRFSLSPLDVMDIFHEFARNHYVIAISHSSIRSILIRYPVLRPLLWPARVISMMIRWARQ